MQTFHACSFVITSPQLVHIMDEKRGRQKIVVPLITQLFKRRHEQLNPRQSGLII